MAAEKDAVAMELTPMIFPHTEAPAINSDPCVLIRDWRTMCPTVYRELFMPSGSPSEIISCIVSFRGLFGSTVKAISG